MAPRWGLGESYLAVGVVHPGVGSLLPTYLGVGTALVAGSTLGWAAHITRADWVTHHRPLTLRRGCLVVGSGGTALVGGTLLAAVTRNGLTATAVAMAESARFLASSRSCWRGFASLSAMVLAPTTH